MKLLESPSQVGSITQSSRFLAEKMVEPIHWDQGKAVAELGAPVLERLVKKKKAGQYLLKAQELLEHFGHYALVLS